MEEAARITRADTGEDLPPKAKGYRSTSLDWWHNATAVRQDVSCAPIFLFVDTVLKLSSRHPSTSKPHNPAARYSLPPR
jgi:hypothetical protein